MVTNFWMEKSKSQNFPYKFTKKIYWNAFAEWNYIECFGTENFAIWTFFMWKLCRFITELLTTIGWLVRAECDAARLHKPLLYLAKNTIDEDTHPSIPAPSSSSTVLLSFDAHPPIFKMILFIYIILLRALFLYLAKRIDSNVFLFLTTKCLLCRLLWLSTFFFSTQEKKDRFWQRFRSKSSFEKIIVVEFVLLFFRAAFLR